jgi:DNA repair exonuclease SbcCD nuclease subunit
MERPKMKKVDAILTSDWHIMERRPPCRTEDDFIDTQWRKMKFIAGLALEHDCPIFHAGDLFDRAKSSPLVERLVIESLRGITIYCAPGQHDLPNHNLELFEQSSLAVLSSALHTDFIVGLTERESFVVNENGMSVHIVPFGEEPCNQIERGKIKALLWHRMTWGVKEPFPGCDLEGNAIALLEKYPMYDLIVTGDNHQSLFARCGGRLLVNPGSLMRIEAGQADYRPKAWLWHAEDNSFDTVEVPIAESDMSRVELDEEKRRDGILDAFVKWMDRKGDPGSKIDGIDFRRNMERFLAENRPGKDVEIRIWEAMEKSCR